MNTKALKQKILDLAIHGKLLPLEKVEKIRKEEPASGLLEKIRAEKQEKIAKGELKKDKNDSFIFVGDDKRHYEKFADGSVKDIEDEIPFDVPDGWNWCRLGNVCKKLVDGNHNPPKGIENKTDYLMLSSRNINSNTIVDLENVRYLTKEMFEIENKRTQLASGDILFTSVGSLGRSCIFDGVSNFCFQRSVTVIDTNIFNNWVKYFFDSNYYQDYVIENATGTAQLGFYMQQMSDSFIVVPPLAEQQLIVAEIEKIFAQIDLLEQNKSDLQTAIKQAKSKILDVAIHGKLVPQDPNDEPAEELLKRIATSDNRPYKKLSGDEIPFELPKTWIWQKLPDLCSIPITDGTHKTPTYSDKENGIPFLSSKDVTSGEIDWSKIKYITKELHEELYKRLAPQKDDILLAKNGTTGIAALVKDNTVFDIYVTLALIRPISKIIYPQYLLYIINSQFCKNQFNDHLTGIGVPNLHLVDINKTAIPLPPISEQQRIVSKIEELFEYTDIINISIKEF